MRWGSGLLGALLLWAGAAAAQSLVPLGGGAPAVVFEPAPPAAGGGAGVLPGGVLPGGVPGFGAVPVDGALVSALFAPERAPVPPVRGEGATGLAAPPPPPDGEEMARRFQLAEAAGWIVVDLDTGEVLEAHNADRLFVPASVAKLPTALYALDVLGPDWRFETRLVASGAVTGSTLAGDLYLQGGGDPELDTDGLLPLVTALTQGGIRRVEGAFYVDGGAAVELAAIDPDQPIDAPYNPALSGLCLNFNRVHLSWRPRSGREPDLAVEARAARLSPPAAGIRVALSSYSGAPTFSHAVEDGVEVWRIRTAALGRRAGSRWLPVRQPALYAGRVFAGLAETYGLALPGPREGAAPVMGTVLARHASRPLALILGDMLEHSTNLTAELVGIAASRAGGALPGDPVASAAMMNAWAAGFAGFPAGDPGFRLANHSGLSLASEVTPRRMAEVLLAAARRPALRGFEDTAVPGMVAGLLKRHNIADDGVALPEGLVVRAKTGTMNFVRGLAGYIATPGGRRLAFAYFANDIAARGGGGDRNWLGRAKGLERALIRSWAARYERG